MGDVSKAIEKYISDYIQLSRSDISASARSREWFLTRIENVVASRKNEPVLFKPRFVYFGSYFKGTKVQVVDEYDVLVVIDSNTGVFSSGEVAIGRGQGVAVPNHKYDNRYQKEGSNSVSPAKMLNWLRGVILEITDVYGGEAPERQGQAVSATIKSQNLKIDLVPAGIFSRNNDGTTFYIIPNGRKDNGWIVTSPESDINALNNVAIGKNNFKNVIRIVKRIKEKYNFIVPSFAIETAIVNYGCSSVWYNNIFYDTLGAVEHIGNMFRGGRLDDPFDSTKNLFDGVENISWYADRLSSIATSLRRCGEIVDQGVVYKKVVDIFENQ